MLNKCLTKLFIATIMYFIVSGTLYIQEIKYIDNDSTFTGSSLLLLSLNGER
jgi:hypothetical protein